MAIPVSDRGAFSDETILRAAKNIGRSKRRRKVFEAIYTGRRNPKTADQIARATRLSNWQVLTEGRKLADLHIVEQVKVDGRVAYGKDRFYARHRDRILDYVDHPKKMGKVATVQRPSASRAKTVNLSFQAPARRIRAKHITIDEIPAFSKVRRIKTAPKTPIPEARFKEGVQRLLCERGRFKDWGGENNDLSTTRLRLGGKRREAVFAFKGPGKRVKTLKLKHMGKNGDQVLRLVRSHGEVFVVQFWEQIDEAVRTELAMLAAAKSVMDDKPVWYCVIDGQDTDRLIAAYPEAFEERRSRRRKR